MRYAVYFTPPADDPLTRTAAAWLGRDAFTDRTAPAGAAAALRDGTELTTSARRYGFHATMKAPFTLKPGETEASLHDTFDHFAETVRPAIIDRLALKRIEGFFALLEGAPTPALQSLAADAVTVFDRFRAPLTERDMARRNPDALTEVQRAHLVRWGYPYVFDAFRFHMTLTDRVADADRDRVEAALRETFAAHLDRPLVVDALALFVEPEPGAPFTVGRFRRLGPIETRKTA